MFSSPPPLCSLSVGSGWRLWDADSGTLGSLHGPAQCITTPLSPDALSYSNIRHQSLCAVSPPWFACYCFCCWHSLSHHTPDWPSLLPEYTSHTASAKLSLLLNTSFQLISQVLQFVNGGVVFIILFLLGLPWVGFHSFQGFFNPWLLLFIVPERIRQSSQILLTRIKMWHSTAPLTTIPLPSFVFTV